MCHHYFKLILHLALHVGAGTTTFHQLVMIRDHSPHIPQSGQDIYFGITRTTVNKIAYPSLAFDVVDINLEINEFVSHEHFEYLLNAGWEEYESGKNYW